MTTSVTRPRFTTQHQTCKTKTTACKTKTKTDFFCSQTGLVLRPTVSDHITNKQPIFAMLWLQLRFDFDSTAVRLLIKGH